MGNKIIICFIFGRKNMKLQPRGWNSGMEKSSISEEGDRMRQGQMTWRLGEISADGTERHGQQSEFSVEHGDSNAPSSTNEQ